MERSTVMSGKKRDNKNRIGPVKIYAQNCLQAPAK